MVSPSSLWSYKGPGSAGSGPAGERGRETCSPPGSGKGNSLGLQRGVLVPGPKRRNLFQTAIQWSVTHNCSLLNTFVTLGLCKQ